MYRVYIVLLIVVLLISCSSSQEKTQALWDETQTEITVVINRIEQLKNGLQAAWDADLASEDPKALLMSKESAVRTNLADREKLLNALKPLTEELANLKAEDLTATQLAQVAQPAKYLEAGLAGLKQEQTFFDQMASGKFMNADLQAQTATIEANRAEQTKNLTTGSVETMTQPPAETATETTSEPVSQAAKYRLNQVSQLFEPIGDAPAKAVLLTFDDVPITGDAKQSLAIAKVLKDQDIPAIFFVYGAYLNSETGKQTVKKIHDMGFAIGNHSQNHPDLTSLSPEGIRQELQTLNDQLVEITGEAPKYFRPPYGSTNQTVSDIAREMGMLPMNWTYGYDWETDYQSADKLGEIMVDTPLLIPGANLLMHDRQNTAEAMSRIVTGIKDKGYEFIRPEEISHEN